MNFAHKTVFAVLGMSLLLPLGLQANHDWAQEEEHEQSTVLTTAKNAIFNKYTAGLAVIGASAYYGYKHGNPFTTGNFGQRFYDYSKIAVQNPRLTAQIAWDKAKNGVLSTKNFAVKTAQDSFDYAKDCAMNPKATALAAYAATKRGVVTAGDFAKAGYNKLFKKAPVDKTRLQEVSEKAQDLSKQGIAAVKNGFNVLKNKISTK